MLGRAHTTLRERECHRAHRGSAAALSPGRLEKLKRLTLRNLECFAGDGLAVRVQLDELRERLVEAASGGSGDDASDPHERETVRSFGPFEPPRTP